MTYLIASLIGTLAGIFGGFFGIGGAVIIVPALVYLFKFSQHTAQGTALGALLFPIGILAVIKYYQAGHVNIKIAVLIAVGFFIGGYVGAYFAHLLPTFLLKKIFALLLLALSIHMFVGK